MKIISGHYNGGRYYESNKRTIAAFGVEHVMRVFRMTYLDNGQPAKPTPVPVDAPKASRSMLDGAFPEEQPVICDEEQFGTNVGF